MEAIAGSADREADARLRLALDGDAEAFAQIVDDHHADMVKVCFAICGDVDLAHDAVQAAWPRAWQRLPSLRDASRLRPWLISIAANEARDQLRSHRRRPVVELDLDEAGVGGDPGARAADIDLRRALSTLSPDDRALIALRYLAGFDSFELARALGISPSGTRARLARLLDRLRTELRE
jgi:RNA polymerase sigma-70 factor (ECF subfamily)